MLRLRRLVTVICLVICLVILTAAESSAFKFDIHAAITQEALAEFTKTALAKFVATVPPDKKEMFQSGFSSDAIQEIVDANKAMDTGDCNFPDPLHPLPTPDPDVPAIPCSFPSETVAALRHLADEPPEEHFDREKIQEASDRVFNVTGEIRTYLLKGQFMAARRELGGALHSIQDFYAHTNWVELGNTDYERRLGTKLNAFSDGSRPRIATSGEPTCQAGQRLFTDLTLQEQKDLLQNKINASQLLDKLRTDRPLTSGYFFIWDLYDPSPLNDTPEITESGKCRHGYKPFDAPYEQPGINKDDPSRRGYDNARALAWGHTVNYIVALFNDSTLRKAPNYVDLMLGLMGHSTKVIDIENVTVGVPGAPNGDSWDTAVGSVLGLLVRGTQGLKNIQPDIYVCMESGNLRGTCAPTCEDADWSNDSNAYVCARPFGVRSEASLHVLLREVDFGQARRVIADFRIDDATKCNPSYTSRSNTTPSSGVTPPGTLPVARPDSGACRLELEPGRTVWIQFQVKGAPALTPPPGVPPPLPPAPPGAGTGGYPPPPAGTSPPAVPPAPAPTGSGGGTSPIALGTSPPAVPPGVAPAPTGGVGPGPTSPRVPSAPPTTAPTTPTARRLLTPAEIDAALGLRDADGCVGNDMFFPPGTALTSSQLGQQLGQVQASRLYQASAFAMAISDPTVKQTVLNTIQAKAGDDAFFGVMTLMLGDVQQSQALVAAYQNTASYIVQRIVSAGLNSLLPPPPKPATALTADVDRWILKRLATGPLVSTAVDMMLTSSSPITAECTLNELAKEGFTDTIYGQ